MRENQDRTVPSFEQVKLQAPPSVWMNERLWPWDTVIPNYCNLWFTLSGQGTMWVDDVEYEISPGSAFILTPGQHVQAVQKPGAPVSNFSAHFYVCTGDGKKTDAPEFPMAGVVVHDIVLFELAARHIVRLASSVKKEEAMLAEQWAFILISQVIHDAQSIRRDAVDQRILAVADQAVSFQEKRMTVEDMACEAGLSRVHFTRRFQRLTGESPSQYLIRRRIDQATHLIRHCHMTVEETADILGYSDVYFFSRQYKQYTGVPPSHVRQNRDGSE